MMKSSERHGNKMFIMRGQPMLVVNGREMTIQHRQPACLLRLLVLKQGHTVFKEEVAKLNGTDVEHVRGKVTALRKELRRAGLTDDVVETVDGLGYRLGLDGWYVDAVDFKTMIEGVGEHFDPSSRTPVSVEEAEAAVPQLSKALDLWRANPGHGLLPFGFETQFEKLKEKAEKRRMKARLATANVDRIREVIWDLDAQISVGDVDPWVWELLLLAHHALVNTGSITNTVERIIKHYPPSKVPAPLQSLIESVMGGQDIANPFRLDGLRTSSSTRRHRTSDEFSPEQKDRLLELCSTVGIQPESELKLKGTQMEPLPCIQRTRTRLYFSGVLASKWVRDDDVRAALEQLLTRLDDIGGQVRFMGINPLSEAYERLRQLREGAIDESSMKHFARLLAEHPSFQMRVFNSLPSFRIIVIDTSVVYFSPYRLAAETYATTKGGMESPHLVLDPLAPYPLSEAFERLFTETWENATDLRKIIGDIVK